MSSVCAPSRSSIGQPRFALALNPVPTELFRNPNHTCLMFSELGYEGGEAVQSNQFLIVDHGVGAIIDPGGNLAFNELYLAMSKYFAPNRLSYVIASHA